MRCTVAVILALNMGLLPVSVSAQRPKAGETITVTVVEVPVNVADKEGSAIRGLTRENFELIDGGKKRDIEYFEVVDLQKVTAVEGQPSRPVPPSARRSFLLLFDFTYSSPQALLRARAAATDFAKGMLAPRDLVAVATFHVESGFNLLTAFTTDRQLVVDAIDSLGTPKFFQPADPLAFARADLPTGASSVGQIDKEQEIMENLQALTRGAERASEDYERGRIRRQIQTFGAIARSLDAIRGRKQVILLSEGFDARLVQGKDIGAASAADQEAIIRGEIWSVDSNQRFGDTSSMNAIEEMGQFFRRSDVTLHAFDIRGLRADVDQASGLTRTSGESLFMLAESTGGALFRNANTLGDEFQRLMTQQEVVYILGFQSKPTGKPGAFHELKVKTKGVEGARVFHRSGYYEEGGGGSVQQALSAIDILESDVPIDDIGLRVLAVPFPLQGGRWQVPVVIELAGQSLLERAYGEQLNGELFVYAFDMDGAARDFLYQRLSFDLTKTRQALALRGAKYYGTLALPPGRYTIKALFRSLENAKAGYRSTTVRIPSPGEGTVLGAAAFDESQWVMLKGASRAEGAPYPFQLGESTFIPAAELRTEANRPFRCAVFVSGLQPETLALKATLKGDRRGTPLPVTFIGRTSADESGSYGLLLEITPADLAPGAYSAALALREELMNVEMSGFTVDIPFRIVE